jgi:hypothetical protein
MTAKPTVPFILKDSFGVLINLKLSKGINGITYQPHLLGVRLRKSTIKIKVKLVVSLMFPADLIGISPYTKVVNNIIERI